VYGKNGSNKIKGGKMIRRLCIIGIVVVFAKAGSSSVEHTLNFSVSDLSFSQSKGYDIVELDDASLMDAVGEPMLPVKHINLIIPGGHVVSEVTFSTLTCDTLSGTYLIYPAQYPVVMSGTGGLPQVREEPAWVDPDSAIYSQSTPYPGEIAEVESYGGIGGSKVVQLAVHPVQWIPSTGKLVLYTTIGINLSLMSSTGNMVVPSKLSKTSYNIYHSMLYTAVENKNDVSAYEYPHHITQSGVRDYVIITKAAWLTRFHPLVDRLMRKGLRTSLTSLEYILANYPGQDAPEQVRNYLTYMHTTHGTVWVLLGGDDRWGGATHGTETVPVRIVRWYLGGHGGPEDPNWNIPTDIYYSDLTSAWAPLPGHVQDQNHGWEEQDANYYHSLNVGRLPFTVSDAADGSSIGYFVDKLADYEDNPGNGDLSYLTKCYWTESDQMQRDDEPFKVSVFFPSFFSHLIVGETPTYDAPTPSHPRGHEVIEEMSTGYGMVSNYNHGQYINYNPLVHLVAYWDVHQTYVYSLNEIDDGAPSSFNFHPENNGLDNLTNTDKYFLWHSPSCKNAGFDVGLEAHPCIAEMAIGQSNKGAVAFLGNTRFGWVTTSCNLHGEFCKSLFGQGGYPQVWNVGATEALSKITLGRGGDCARYLSYAHNVFGCPETPIWTNTPGQLVVEHTPSAYAQLFEVKVNVKGAKVCLYKRGGVQTNGYLSDVEIFRVGEANVMEDPWAVVRFPHVYPESPGRLYVTVTEHNYLPYYGHVVAGAGHGGENWVITSDTTIDHWQSDIDTFKIESGVEVSVTPYNGNDSTGTVWIDAQTIIIDGALSADGAGYEASEGPGQGTDGSSYYGAGGGAYGGRGGHGGWGLPGDTAQAGGYAYSDSAHPDEMGSGGGDVVDPDGGRGGGIIKLSSSNATVINGRVSSDGGCGTGSGEKAAGGGSGGSIWIETPSLSGSGLVAVRGGSGANGSCADGGGGSGGRIRVTYVNSSFNGRIEVSGGTGPNHAVDGQCGTALVQRADTSVSLLISPVHAGTNPDSKEGFIKGS
jgi:hypothetical protein